MTDRETATPYAGPSVDDVIAGMQRRGASEELIAAYREREGVRPPATMLSVPNVADYGYRMGKDTPTCFTPEGLADSE